MTEQDFDTKWDAKWNELHRKFLKLIVKTKGTGFTVFADVERLKKLLEISIRLEEFEASRIISNHLEKLVTKV